MGKYGTNYTGFGAYEGGVNSDKGAPLVATNSDGETSLLFGAPALREIQAGVANGDFAIPPDNSTDTIGDENPLPYWTFTDDSSVGAITCALVPDSTSGSGNILQWTVAANTTASKTATMSRYVPIPVTQDRAYSFFPEFAVAVTAGSTNRSFIMTMQFYTDALVATGTAITHTYALTSFTTASRTATFIQSDADQRLNPPADARFAKISMQVTTTGTNATATIFNVYEVKLLIAPPMILIGERNNPGGSGPGAIWNNNGSLYISNKVPDTWTTGVLSTTLNNIAITSTNINLTASTNIVLTAPTVNSVANLNVTGNITATGSLGLTGATYGSTALTGPSFQLAGTTGAAWVFSNASGAADVLATNSTTRAGVLVTKSTAGQPSTVVNGTATTDAFADALRNGGLASDNTNGRFYVYNGSAWKYAALTTPSDSRLKEEITSISGALDTLRQLVPVAFRWKRPEAHQRTDAVADDGKRLGFIADQVATTDLKHWVEDMGVGEIEHDLVEETDGRVLAVNIPQNEMEALVVQALLDIDTRLKALESR